MAAIQSNLTDGVGSAELKYQQYIEQIPGVDQYFLSRCYNAADSLIYKTKGDEAQLESRETGLTYQLALRKLARRLCLQERGQKQRQKNAIIRTRAFLGQDFFDLMGFYGVDIIHPHAGDWYFSESMGAEAMAAFLDF